VLQCTTMKSSNEREMTIADKGIICAWKLKAQGERPGQQ